MASSTAASAVVISSAASIVLFNRGPIPTSFSAPATCLSTLTSVSGGGLYFGHTQNGSWDSACYPPLTTTKNNPWNLYYYSPAVSCPSGWSTVSTATRSFGGLSSSYLSLGSDTTAALCYPTGYTTRNFDHQSQSSFPVATNTVKYLSASSDIGGNWHTASALSTTVSKVTGTSDWVVFGDGIPIWFQASDKAALTASKTASHSTSSVNTPLPTSSSVSPIPSPDGLSTGAKTGIGVGVALVVLILAAIAGFFIFKGRQRYQAAPTENGSQDITADNIYKSELPAEDRPASAEHEMYSEQCGDNAVEPQRHECRSINEKGCDLE